MQTEGDRQNNFLESRFERFMRPCLQGIIIQYRGELLIEFEAAVLKNRKTWINRRLKPILGKVENTRTIVSTRRLEAENTSFREVKPGRQFRKKSAGKPI